ncbi:expressed unknown protein [Seminavis robusta]|uniref:DUF7467 domain-containing protein n=1 Tax=Seminavis robusta TaxID=568900 RepID=A0A9N8E805_9STRA|nr:expressed unknown protein [Seminavis robusta]|eukprot:Sro645_g180640.1 n/a (407) ;mRNA; r:30634-31854
MLLPVSSRAFAAVLWLAALVVGQSQDCNNTVASNGVDFGCNVDSPICVGANKAEPAMNKAGVMCKHCLSAGAAAADVAGLVDVGCTADKEVCVDDGGTPVLARQGGSQCVRNCNISVEVTSCTLQSGPSAGAPCDAPVQEICRGRKSTITMRYNGGSCLQSNTIQESGRFECFDSGEGPPVEEGSTVFIVVEDPRNNEVLHSGVVAVGSTFNIDAIDDGDDDSPRVPAGATIMIYNSSNTEDPSALLQVVTFQIHCSFGRFGLYIGDTFGASTFVGFSTQGSGVPPPSTGLVLASVDILVALPSAFAGESIAVTSLEAGTGFGTVDLFDQLSDPVLGNTTALSKNDLNPTTSFSASIPFEFDYTLGPRVITATVKLVAQIGAGSELCTGKSAFSFKTSVTPIRESV